MLFSHLMVVNSFTTIYYILLRINTYPPDKSGKCGHARRFGSPSGGSESHLYCISAHPFAAAGHELEPGPGRGRLHVGGTGIEGAEGVRWWACWPDMF